MSNCKVVSRLHQFSRERGGPPESQLPSFVFNVRPRAEQSAFCKCQPQSVEHIGRPENQLKFES